MSTLDFLNNYYQKVAWIYDASRAYYLLGRDQVLEEIAQRVPSGGMIVEVGAGTGRNLIHLHRRLKGKQVQLFAVEPCSPMQEKIKKKAKSLDVSIQLIPKFADAWTAADIGQNPDIIFFSYSLSMFDEPRKAVEHALDQLKPGGRLYIVDFGLLEGVPRPFRLLAKAFSSWLGKFHVRPEKLWKELESLPLKAVIHKSPFGYVRSLELIYLP